jgi:type I restriction enzyme M protein
VTGLCKLATKEEVAEQGYSLNPGRYVGIVIEEDGKTVEEFRIELLAMNAELELLHIQAADLVATISHNTKKLVGVI